jgi:hypothetical protein
LNNDFDLEAAHRLWGRLGASPPMPRSLGPSDDGSKIEDLDRIIRETFT